MFRLIFWLRYRLRYVLRQLEHDETVFIPNVGHSLVRNLRVKNATLVDFAAL